MRGRSSPTWARALLRPVERIFDQVVASHQDVGDQGEFEVFPNGRQALEKLLAVTIAQEQVADVAAASGEMINACVDPM